MPRETTITRTLMCRDHEAATFSYDPVARRVVGRPVVHDPAYLPLGCLDQSGRFAAPRLRAWLANRAVPATRPGLAPVLQRLGLETPEELLAEGLGLSLSDQYWLRPPDADLAWSDVNYFERPFSPALGAALAPHDPDSGSEALEAAGRDGIVIASSPDSALNGNLPKRWEARGSARVLVKSGKPESLFQEPLNERIATLLCARIMGEKDYVPYELMENGYPRLLSSCPCMVDAWTEFVPAADVILSMPVPNDQSRFEALVGACERHGIADARAALERMLVVDHVMANFDRHWGNFGILVDAETRAWLRVTPIFDTGEALWCDRPLANDFSPYRMAHPMPFLRAVGEQLSRYAGGLAWLNADALVGFADEAVGVLEMSPAIAGIPGRLKGVRAAIEKNVAEVRAMRR